MKRGPHSDSKLIVMRVLITGLILLAVAGCDDSPESALRDLYRPHPYKDVTASPEYNFASFTGRVCKTKVGVALADVKAYTGRFELVLLAPIHFDSTRPDYTSGTETHIIAVLPPGTRLRIGRLMKDQGAWGGVQVEAILLDGTNAQKAVYLDGSLLARNKWSGGGLHARTNWGANPELLETP